MPVFLIPILAGAGVVWAVGDGINRAGEGVDKAGNGFLKIAVGTASAFILAKHFKVI